MLEKRFNFKEVEEKLLQSWATEKTFNFKNEKDKDAFCLMMPPPNVTGSLHIGHALTFTLQDIIVRFQKKIGKNVLWQSGTDHAGIATEIVVEQNIFKKEKQTKNDLGREKFIKKIWEWKEESGNNIINQMNRLGTSVDWTRSRFTMDKDLCKVVNKVFIELFNEGLIYKDKRLINWDPLLQTAISDLEVNQKEVNGKMWHLKYHLVDSNEKITIATTRPETMFGDVAIAIHPKNKTLKKFIGKKAIIPFTDREIKIIADSYADPNKGSGAVKITPAHDFNDFEIGIKHNLSFKNIFDKNCKLLTIDIIPKKCRGMDRFEARKKIIKALEKQSLVDKVETNKMVIPYGDRTGEIVEPFLTDQWFVDSKTLCIPIKKKIEKEKIKFHPKLWINTFNHWIDNIQPWCISRQIWWGHRIPIWYSNAGDMIAAENIEEAKKQLSLINKKAVISHQETDVLDTWFSSALWPFSTLGWPKNKDLLNRFYPTNVLVTGFDIIFFWVARMIMMGLKFMKDLPFENIYIHPLVKDEKGQKMSKSKGNVIDPLVLIDKYGADSLRFTLASLSSQGRDIKLSDKVVENSRNFITKLWNVARFAQFNNFKYRKSFDPNNNKLILNKWIYFRYIETKKNVIESISKFKFNLFINELYQFIWNDFCDLFIELSKFFIKEKKDSIAEEIESNFSYIFKGILNMINPVIPFVTEKLSRELKYKKTSLFEESLHENEKVEYDSDISEFIKVIELIKKIRSEVTINKLVDFELSIELNEQVKWVKNNEFLIKSIFKLNEIKYTNHLINSDNTFVVEGVKFSLKTKSSNVDNNLNIEKQINFYKKEIKHFESKLKNNKFLNKAPKKIIEKERDKLNSAIKNLQLLNKKDV